MSTTSVTYSQPFILLWLGNTAHGHAGYCAQASYAGVEGVVQLQTVTQASLQQWVFGSDQRIYLYSSTLSGQAPLCMVILDGTIANGTAIHLDAVVASNKAQMWKYNWQNHTIASQASSGYAIDDSGGGTGAGNKIQLWQATGGANQIWCPQLLNT